MKWWKWFLQWLGFRKKERGPIVLTEPHDDEQAIPYYAPKPLIQPKVTRDYQFRRFSKPQPIGKVFQEKKKKYRIIKYDGEGRYRVIEI